MVATRTVREWRAVGVRLWGATRRATRSLEVSGWSPVLLDMRQPSHGHGCDRTAPRCVVRGSKPVHDDKDAGGRGPGYPGELVSSTPVHSPPRCAE